MFSEEDHFSTSFIQLLIKQNIHHLTFSQRYDFSQYGGVLAIMFHDNSYNVIIIRILLHDKRHFDVAENQSVGSKEKNGHIFSVGTLFYLKLLLP